MVMPTLSSVPVSTVDCTQVDSVTFVSLKTDCQRRGGLMVNTHRSVHTVNRNIPRATTAAAGSGSLLATITESRRIL